MPVNPEVLHVVPLFDGLTDRSFEAVANLASEADFAAGEDLVRQGDPGDTLMIIVTGRTRVARDGRILRDLGPGDFLGEISLVDGSPRTATVTALEPVHALVLGRDGFMDLIERVPLFRLDVLNCMAQRIRAMAGDPLG